MKTLVLIRHGKSSWEHPVSDLHRPLKSRGISDAKLVCDAFLKTDFMPDLVVTSPAKRAHDICKIFTNKMNISSENVQINPTIYDFEGSKTADFIKSLDENYQKVMLFGHNYAFTSLVNMFGNIYIDNLPTSGLVMINFDVDSWKDIKKGTTELMILPRDLKHK
jgi:phosphohistidine phosphatase